MWTPSSVAASTKVVGRMLWPLARSSIRSQSQGEVSRSFGTSPFLKANGKDGCFEKPPKNCAKICNQGQKCEPKPPKCKKRPCLPPCHACPQEDPCWHCPFVPPPCPKRKPCCPICPPVNPYLYKSNCCPPVDVCKKKCVPCDPPPPPPRRLTRCELPGAMDDPCCSRQPKCPDPCDKDKKEDICQTDCPERPSAPDPCKIDGEICSEEPCEFKKPEKCCSQTPAKDVNCCPRRQNQKKKKKRIIKKTCCLDLDPNWPPKRPECDCGFPAKELGPCVQAKSPKKDFWDGLC